VFFSYIFLLDEEIENTKKMEKAKTKQIE